MDTNYEKAVNNIERLYRAYEDKLPLDNRSLLEWSILFLKDYGDYREKVVRQ